MLTRDAILGASDLKTEDVMVPEWGGVVRVRMMTARDRDSYESSFLSVQNGKVVQNMDGIRLARARLLALTVVGEDGKPLFTESDVEALAGKSAAAVQRVFEVAQRLNKVSDDDVKELAGN